MPRIARKTPKSRLNLEMTVDAKSKLEALRETTGADSLSEVIRRSLVIYDFLWQEKVKGSSIFVRSHTEKVTEVILL